MKTRLVAGSRDSALALTQTHLVMDALKAQYPDIEIELKTYKTQGDIILDTALSQVGGKGLFVKELEQALLNQQIDFAVHSMKDMPGEIPQGLALFTFGQREIPQDALISKRGLTFEALPTGAVIGTSSLRRQAILKRARPELNFQIVRGNVQTRLRKLEEGPYDAIVLAVAGLHRLSLQDRITQVFTPDEMLPACCQGTLALETRGDDLKALFAPFQDVATEVCTAAERGFLKTLEGGCQVPMAAFARQVSENSFHLQGMVCDPDGAQMILAAQDFAPTNAEEAGCLVAREILSRGGAQILAALLHGQANG